MIPAQEGPSEYPLSWTIRNFYWDIDASNITEQSLNSQDCSCHISETKQDAKVVPQLFGTKTLSEKMKANHAIPLWISF